MTSMQGQEARPKPSLRTRIRSLIRNLGGLTVIALVVFIGAKGCVTSVWVSPKEVTTYDTMGEGGRFLTLTFLPENQTLISFVDSSRQEAEIVLAKMRGTRGTHYVGTLWQIAGPGIWIGLRLYPRDVTPFVIEVEILEKFRTGRGDPIFPAVGKRTRATLLFGKDRLRFQNTWLDQVPTDPEYVERMMNKLRNQ